MFSCSVPVFQKNNPSQDRSNNVLIIYGIHWKWGDQDNQPLIFYKLRIPSTLMEIMNIVRYTYIRYVVGTLDSMCVFLSFSTWFIVSQRKLSTTFSDIPTSILYIHIYFHGSNKSEN